MKLVIYNTANSRTAEDRIGRRSIRFNSVNGNMYLSLHLTKDLNVKPGDRLEFARDEDDPKAWFLRKTTDKQGFPCNPTEAASACTTSSFAKLCWTR